MTTTTATDYRLTVTPDPDAEGPLEWGTLVVVPWRRALGGHLDQTPSGGADDLDLMHAAERFTGRGVGGGRGLQPRGLGDPTGDQIADAVIRWAAVFRGTAVVRWQPTGYSQSAWGDGLAYLPADSAERAGSLADQAAVLAAELATASQWYRGDVFIVTLERRITWQRTDGGEGTITTWEPVDSVSGCYLETEPDGYTAREAAAEHFLLPEGVDAYALEVVEP